MSTLVEAQVSDELLTQYAKLIYDTTGISISAQKKALLSNRLRRRLRATGIASFELYYSHLRRLPLVDKEWSHFLQEITTHETYLFRDEAHWQWFQFSYLPQIADQARRGTRQKQLRIWSAACSTGDEAATIAACIATHLPGASQWKIKILGTDIGIEAVEQARTMTFGSRSMRLVPAEIQKKCFGALGDQGPWKAKLPLQQMVEFRRHNLLDPLPEQAFDVVFLKNVLIYFDGPSKAKAMKNICRLMKPGSLLVAGAAEGISDFVKEYDRLHPWLFAIT